MSRSSDTGDETFSKEERAAMKERAAELRAEKRSGTAAAKAAQDAEAVQAAIEAMPEPDRALAALVSEVVAESAPDLAPKTWYGMPAWARKGKVVLFFQGGEKFSTRYSTLGFSDLSALDDGPLWPTSFALTEAALAEKDALVALVKRAAG